MKDSGHHMYRPGMAAMALLAAFIAVAGCNNTPPSANRFDLVIGSIGHTAGKFNRPRGIVHYPEMEAIFVVDWDGRIQKFTTNGEFRASWLMPDVRLGKPEDLCVDSHGNILVADTHYSRIVEFSSDGKLLGTFGKYGKAPGDFIYPVGVCRDRAGNVYVSEYGENDRIQKFSPDKQVLAQIGRPGGKPGEFLRPSGITISTNDLLFVADAVNHRIQVFETSGKFIRTFGREGTAPGEFRYPYDVAISGDTLYVLEYGNQRVQKLTLEGKPLAVIGGPGSGDGRFNCPWRCETVSGSLYVSDTENNRVVVLK